MTIPICNFRNLNSKQRKNGTHANVKWMTKKKHENEKEKENAYIFLVSLFKTNSNVTNASNSVE